jgi:DNA processing protein
MVPDVQLRLALVLHGVSASVVRRAAADAPCPPRLLDEAERLLARLQQQGVTVLACGAAGYPARLLDLSDPPPLLFVRGALPEGPSLAVVGTRRLDAAGERVTRLCAQAGLDAGRLIVSGGAAGADTLAHEAALEAGAPTIAVLGSGLDHPFPSENARLFDRIAERGAVVSELLPAVRSNRWTFPRRNRLVAALAHDVVVTRAPARSGALITARLAAELGRPVWCVPGDPTDPSAEGTLDLLARGARPVVGREAFAQALGASPGVPPVVPTDTGTPDEVAVLGALLSGACDLDTLAERTRLASRHLAAVLTGLELDGRVRRVGASFVRSR